MCQIVFKRLRWGYVLLLLCLSQVIVAQGAYHEDGEFIIRAGVINSDFRYGNNVGLTLNATYFPYEVSNCGFAWNAGFTKTKDYWSLNPIGATSTLLNIFCRSMMDGLEPWMQSVFWVMSAESMGVYIPIGERFEIQPYWSLLRLSKYKKDNVLLTGAFGLSASVYFDRFSVTGFGEYSFGYGSSNWYGQWFHNIFVDDEEGSYEEKYEKPCTPFKGWNYGITLGYSF